MHNLFKVFEYFNTMITIKPFKQKTGISFCGPACLKMVLSYFGIERSERDLAKISGCSPVHGLKAEGILKTAKKLGFMGFIKDFSTMKDLEYYVKKKKIPVIVDWFSPGLAGESIDGHYSVVVNIDKENIYLQDPELGYSRALRIQVFKRLWFDFAGDYIASKDDMIIRRMIVLAPNTSKIKETRKLLKA